MNDKFKIEALSSGKYIIRKRNMFLFYNTLCELVVPQHITRTPDFAINGECYYQELQFGSENEAKEYLNRVYKQ